MNETLGIHGSLLLTLLGAVVVLATACGSPGAGPSSESESEGSSGGAGSTGPGATSTSGPPPTTTTDQGTTAGLDTGASDSTGLVFIQETDGCIDGPGDSMWHCTYECSVVTQDCDEDEKCMPWANDGGPAWNASRCSPIDPRVVPPGGACTVVASPVSGHDDCAVGSMCWGVDPDSLQGTCIALCDPEQPDACAAPQRCVPLNDGQVPVCLSPCDPLQDGSCPDGEACRFVPGDDFVCLPLLGGQVMTSAVCTDEVCAPDSTCLDAELLPGCGGSCCSPWCDDADPGADAQCAALDPALGCQPFYAPGTAPPGLETLGVCAELP